MRTFDRVFVLAARMRAKVPPLVEHGNAQQNLVATEDLGEAVRGVAGLRPPLREEVGLEVVRVTYKANVVSYLAEHVVYPRSATLLKYANSKLVCVRKLVTCPVR